MEFPEFDRFAPPRRWVSRVFIHCSAHDAESTNDAAVIDRWHRDRGWRCIGYHYFIKLDGTIQCGRPINQIPAAQAGHNTGSIAICLHGGQNSKDKAFNYRQFDALRGLCREIDEAYRGKITFHGHREVAAKACPVFDYKEILGLDAKGRLKKGVVTPQKLEAAGSRTAKAVRRNNDSGVAVIGVGVAGGTAEALKKLKDLTDSASGWRTALDSLIDTFSWVADYWYVGVAAAGGVFLWNNRKIIRARIDDEVRIRRLSDD